MQVEREEAPEPGTSHALTDTPPPPGPAPPAVHGSNRNAEAGVPAPLPTELGLVEDAGRQPGRPRALPTGEMNKERGKTEAHTSFPQVWVEGPVRGRTAG